MKILISCLTSFFVGVLMSLIVHKAYSASEQWEFVDINETKDYYYDMNTGIPLSKLEYIKDKMDKKNKEKETNEWIKLKGGK